MFNKAQKIGKKLSSAQDIHSSNPEENLIAKIKADKNQYELTDVGVPLTSHGFLSPKSSRNPSKEKDLQLPYTGKLATILEDSSEEESSNSELTL
ncbi:hypothetical protein [Legionella parisiensis]|uniref:Uncharacterized protein n=1 Tax=Legionella parisiensis TaxID=45071 RepID=A0A1E5JS27_9GAMM|nr:hypothetical protein [Legionella parisiensis]KTD40892.1 hypothetical protein Lpar_2209 [Legionella parisiensis]OEH47329.1 hypothetical protein lpari_01642 [Legionella parisiensis]STX72166.1 Uncharacterised protein [Legionella parisiensis]